MTVEPVVTARQDVLAVLENRVEACRVKDIDALMSLYAPDIVYFDIIPPHQFVGTEAVRRNFLRWFDEYEGEIELETYDLSVVVDGDVAFAHMLHPDSGTRRNGQDVEVWVRSTVCLQQRRSDWLITHEHISFPINPNDWSAVVDVRHDPAKAGGNPALHGSNGCNLYLGTGLWWSLWKTF